MKEIVVIFVTILMSMFCKALRLNKITLSQTKKKSEIFFNERHFLERPFAPSKAVQRNQKEKIEKPKKLKSRLKNRKQISTKNPMAEPRNGLSRFESRLRF
jgi:hypothetical protein